MAPGTPGPSVPTRSTRRLTWHLLAFGVVLILGAGLVAGILLAVGNSEPNSFTGPTSTGARSGTASSGFPTLPKYGGSGGGSISNNTISVTPPGGWKLESKTNVSMDFLSPRSYGDFFLQSGTFHGSQSQFMQSRINDIVKGTTKPHFCGKDVPLYVFNGPKGEMLPICFTIIPQNGQAYEVVVFETVSVTGGVAYEEQPATVASQSQVSKFLSQVNTFGRTIHWKLYRGR